MNPLVASLSQWVNVCFCYAWQIFEECWQGSKHKHQITPLHLYVTPKNHISCYAVDAVNVSQWLPSLLLSYLFPLASRCCKTAHVRPQNFLEVVNLISAVCSWRACREWQFVLLWAGTAPGPPWPDPPNWETASTSSAVCPLQNNKRNGSFLYGLQ